MKTLATLLGLATAIAASAQSYPKAWSYAAPETRAVAGLNYPAVVSSPLGAAILDELDFLDRDFLNGAQQILISSRDYLTMATGQFPEASVRRLGALKKLRPVSYRNVEVLKSPEAAGASVALISEQILLIGTWAAVQAAIDRSVSIRGREPIELLGRAAQLAEGSDFWIIAERFPDELAAAFVPLADGAKPITALEAAVVLTNGLALEAALTAKDEPSAKQLLANLEEIRPALPAVAQSLSWRLDGGAVRVSLSINARQLASGLRGATDVARAAPAAEHAAKSEPGEPAKPEKRVIRIFGLDEGTREIELPRKP
ncbi:MAG: hypothetical protein K2X35_20830 [Bryobacteraceae bacterium]|nr:hypothetical protein [Bryobacteraceae bacterium]